MDSEETADAAHRSGATDAAGSREVIYSFPEQASTTDVATGPAAVPVPGPPPASSAPHSLPATTARLAALEAAELSDHPGIYQEIHRDLQAALAEIDSA